MENKFETAREKIISVKTKTERTELKQTHYLVVGKYEIKKWLKELKGTYKNKTIILYLGETTQEEKKQLQICRIAY